MRKATCHLLLLVALVGAAQSCRSARADGFPWLHDYGEAIELSRSSGKPLFAYLETDWCTYCREMEKTTLIDPAVVGAMNQEFVWLKLNAESNPEGMMLQKRFEIANYPGMLILDPQGEEIDRLTGYLSPEEFRRQVMYYAKGPMALSRLKARVSETPDDARALRELADRHREREEYREAAKVYARALQAEPDSRPGTTDSLLYHQGLSLAVSGGYEEALTALTRAESEFPNSPLAAEVLALKGQVHQSLGKSGPARTAFRKFLSHYPDHRFAPRIRAMLQALGEELPLSRPDLQ